MPEDETPNTDCIKDEYPFEPHFVSVGHYRMHYVDEGTGPVVIMLHACPMWSFFYRKLILDLSKVYRVIAPDNIGFGLSDKPVDYDYRLETHIDNLERLADRLELQKFSVIMHGWGATIGTGYIVRHPHRIQNIVLMNSMAFSGYRLPWRLQLCRVLPWYAEHVAFGLDMIFSGLAKLQPKVRMGYKLPYYNRDKRIALVRFVEDIPCTPDDASYESVIEIEHGLWMLRDHPLCIIWSMNDWLYPERYLNRWLQYCPDAKVYRLHGAGRYLPEEAYEEFSTAVSGFLKAHTVL